MLGLQVGVPGLCIVHDSRTQELCETMKVPFVLASQVQSGVTRKQLTELIQFDPVEFDENRVRLAKNYVSFLESNKLQPADYLLDLAK